MSNDSLPQHPPPHPSHRCQKDAAPGQLDMPTSELQELLTLAKELLEQNSTEEYCEGQTSDSLPDTTQHQTPPREEHPLKPVDTPEAARQGNSNGISFSWGRGHDERRGQVLRTGQQDCSEQTRDL
ncbi:hypothetical protein G5714_002775 [Onychostoma macrolepis]|uniref:Uncharacterized protein n=1 Tax=Onychostoma macrolepis TaxID=369639 RepID=A0A7J6D7M9_9TELE|nr:hypothetical protein G5714_002775 [Onychostoma macrolepis]